MFSSSPNCCSCFTPLSLSLSLAHTHKHKTNFMTTALPFKCQIYFFLDMFKLNLCASRKEPLQYFPFSLKYKIIKQAVTMRRDNKCIARFQGWGKLSPEKAKSGFPKIPTLPWTLNCPHGSPYMKYLGIYRQSPIFSSVTKKLF